LWGKHDYGSFGGADVGRHAPLGAPGMADVYRGLQGLGSNDLGSNDLGGLMDNVYQQDSACLVMDFILPRRHQ
jgi:hypothetical protein